jgi:hypothetical protein
MKKKTDTNFSWDDDFEKLKRKFEGKKKSDYKRKEKYRRDIFGDDRY